MVRTLAKSGPQEFRAKVRTLVKGQYPCEVRTPGEGPLCSGQTGTTGPQIDILGRRELYDSVSCILPCLEKHLQRQLRCLFLTTSSNLVLSCVLGCTHSLQQKHVCTDLPTFRSQAVLRDCFLGCNLSLAPRIFSIDFLGSLLFQLVKIIYFYGLEKVFCSIQVG